MNLFASKYLVVDSNTITKKSGIYQLLLNNTNNSKTHSELMTRHLGIEKSKILFGND